MSVLAPYVPKSLSDVVFSSPVLEKAVQKMASGQFQKSLLLYGDNGTGKTRLGEMILAERYPNDKLYHGHHMYEAAHWTSKNLVGLQNRLTLEYVDGVTAHLTLINEFDRLSPADHSLIQAFLDQYQEHQFIFTTNFAGKVTKSIKSRCLVQQVQMPPQSHLTQIASDILASHSVSISSSDMADLVRNSGQSWRTFETNIELMLP